MEWIYLLIFIGAIAVGTILLVVKMPDENADELKLRRWREGVPQLLDGPISKPRWRRGNDPLEGSWPQVPHRWDPAHAFDPPLDQVGGTWANLGDPAMIEANREGDDVIPARVVDQAPAKPDAGRHPRTPGPDAADPPPP